MELNAFLAEVRRIAERNLTDQNKELTEEAIQSQMVWLAALYDANNIFGGFSLKDLAEFLVAGTPPMELGAWARTVVEDAEDDEVAAVIEQLEGF